MSAIWKSLYSVLLLGLLSAGSHALAQPDLHSSENLSGWITGRVVDEDGQPVAGVRVGAETHAMGQRLHGLHKHGPDPGDSHFNAVSGDDGQFAILVPFKGIHYTVGLTRAQAYKAVQYRTFIVASDQAEPIELVVTPRDRLKPIRADFIFPGGAAVANQVVTLVGGEGERWVSKTDAAGRATFDDLRSFDIGQAVLRVEVDGLVAPLTVVRHRKENEAYRLTLAKPATVTGRVVAKDTGEPIVGVRVVIRPGFASGLKWLAETDEDGRFERSGLPAGRYRYHAVSDVFVEPPPGPREIELLPGRVTEAPDYTMLPRAILRGRVVGTDGKPVAGALVGYRESVLYSDDEGRFEFRPGNFERNDNPNNLIEVFHPLAGGGKLALDVFAPGEERGGIEVRTAGTVAVHGRVTDDQGEPIAGVRCKYQLAYPIETITDVQGRYDLGSVRLRTTEGEAPELAAVLFAPKRPADTYWKPPIPDEPGPFHTGTARQPEQIRDGVVVQDITLQRTDRLVFTGTLKDAAGKPVPKARVYVLPGKVGLESEKDQIRIKHFIASRDRSERSRYSTSLDTSGFHSPIEPIEGIEKITREDYLLHLLVMHTGAEGFWGGACLRTDSDPYLYYAIKQKYMGRQVPIPEQYLQAPVELEWATVLTVWDEGDEVQYKLDPPTPIVADQSRYSFPSDE